MKKHLLILCAVAVLCNSVSCSKTDSSTSGTSSTIEFEEQAEKQTEEQPEKNNEKNKKESDSIDFSEYTASRTVNFEEIDIDIPDKFELIEQRKESNSTTYTYSDKTISFVLFERQNVGVGETISLAEESEALSNFQYERLGMLDYRIRKNADFMLGDKLIKKTNVYENENSILYVFTSKNYVYTISVDCLHDNASEKLVDSISEFADNIIKTVKFKETATVTQEETTKSTTTEKQTTEKTTEKPTETKSEISTEFLNALKKANSYANNQHMSKAKLYEQLTSAYGERFSQEAANYAIENVNTDYNQNALIAADSYANKQHMSKLKLYEQLTSEYGEEFTESEAQYAVDNVQTDYNYNALQTAKSYQEHQAMSKESIYEQLVSEYGEGFTAEEAQYAIDNLE